jgi:uncharacterized protein YbgA (DUF1722 family)/uncharacterized protein YbbK (DUF523 family)
MFTFEKPRIVVSKCIEFEHCRWNGLIIASDVVKLMKPHVELVPVCPEVEIGLGVPREPVRVVAGEDGSARLYQPATDTDWTAEMEGFAHRFLDGLPEVEGFLLKSRSPSCGIKEVKVYPNTPQGMPRKTGSGLFALAVAERFPDTPQEDEGRLTNFRLRETYLTQVFTLREWRDLAAVGTMGALVRFHTRHKLLLMAYNEVAMRDLGRIVANHGGRPEEEVYAAYRAGLSGALARPAGHGPAINVLQHALGYFDDLTSAEKRFFLQSLEDFRAGRTPLSVPTSIVRSWIVRFGQEYLAGQSFFQPYPEDLVQISDSGKGRDL